MDTDVLKKQITNVFTSTYDHHRLFRKLGNALGEISQETVTSGFLTIWNKICQDEARNVASIIENELEKN
jgi:hypothetical protein